MSKRVEYDKAVRDLILEIMEERNVRFSAREASRDDFMRYLERKLVEEVEEYQASRDPMELADILEVCFALAARHGWSESELLQARDRKRTERGGFDRNLVLEWTES